MAIEGRNKRKKLGDSLEALREKGRARQESTDVPALAPVDATESVALPEDIPKNDLTFAELVAVGEADKEFLEQIRENHDVVAVAKEIGGMLSDRERRAFYDGLLFTGYVREADLGIGHAMPTPSYKERDAAYPEARGIELATVRKARAVKSVRSKKFRPLARKEMEARAEAHAAYVPEDEEDAQEFARLAAKLDAPDPAPEEVQGRDHEVRYEDALAAMQKERGAPYGKTLGVLFWKQGDGSVVLLERDGTRWDIPEGGFHRFGAHGRVLTYQWTRGGFVLRQGLRAMPARPREAPPAPLSGEQVKDAEAAFIQFKQQSALAEDLAGALEYAEKTARALQPTRNTTERVVTPIQNEADAVVSLGETAEEVGRKLGAPQHIGRVPYWERPDGTAIVFDASTADGKAIPLVVQPQGMHRFGKRKKRWIPGEGFVDA